MKKIILTKGLPGSGKTTWAKKQIEKDPGVYKRINKDDLREMLHNSLYSSAREKFIIEVRDFLVKKALTDGFSVIIDDTNFNPVHERTMQRIAKECNAVVEIKDFTYVPLEECIKRDLKRPNSVGEKVIKEMHNNYIRPKSTPYTACNSLTEVILVDIDGTLALFGDKNPYSRDFINDIPNQPVVDTAKSLVLAHNVSIIFVSARNGLHFDETKRWLHEKCGFSEESCLALLMRGADDKRKDSVVKTELFDNYIRNQYRVKLVLDDRDQVVRLWRDLGLVCFQVADGDF
jgi:predicted kinase